MANEIRIDSFGPYVGIETGLIGRSVHGRVVARTNRKDNPYCHIKGWELNEDLHQEILDNVGHYYLRWGGGKDDPHWYISTENPNSYWLLLKLSI